LIVFPSDGAAEQAVPSTLAARRATRIRAVFIRRRIAAAG
jgi:hypothetical protein